MTYGVKAPPGLTRPNSLWDDSVYVYGDPNSNDPTQTITAYGTSLAHETDDAFDSLGFKTSETQTFTIDGNPVTMTTSWTYVDIAGQHLPASTTNASGVTTVNSYDSTGNLSLTVVKDKNSVQQSQTGYSGYVNGQATVVTQYTQNGSVWQPYSVSRTSLDGAGRVTETRQEDPSGTVLSRSTFVYDSYGNQTYAITWAKSTPAYPSGASPPALPSGTPASQVLADGTTWYPYNVAQSVYNSQNRLVKSIDPEGNTSQTLYTADGQVYQTIDPRGHITQNAYDALGQLKSVTSNLNTPQQTQQAYTYDADGRRATSTDALGNVTTTLYDAAGRPVQTLNPDGTTSETVYDAAGRVSLTTDPHAAGQPADATQTLYDDGGRTIGANRYTGTVVGVSTSNGTSTSSVSTQGTLVSSTTTHYNALGQTDYTVDAAGQKTTYGYDALGRQATVTDALNNTTTNTFDALGRRASTQDPLGRTTRYRYDALGRPTETDAPDGTSTQTAYDDLGRKIASTDQLGQTTTYAYDAAGDLTDVYQPPVPDPLNNNTLTTPHTHYAYDALGDELTQTDANSHTTTWTYDPYGRELTRQLPLGQVESSTYDALGRPLTHTDFNGQISLNVYDDSTLVPIAQRPHLGRLYARYFYQDAAHYNAGAPNETVVYSYDALGRQTRVTDTLTTPSPGDARSPFTYTTTSNYDGENRLTESDSPEGSIHYVFDAATGRHTETWTGATSAVTQANAVSDVLYGYDVLGRLASVTAEKQSGAKPAAGTNGSRYTATGVAIAADAPTTLYNYDAAGRLSNVSQPNAVTAAYTYQPNTDYVQQLTYATPSAVLGQYTYTYRGDGQRVTAQEHTLNADGTTYADVTLAWSYDALDRLTQEQANAPNGSPRNYADVYTYDLTGNRTRKAHDQNRTGVPTETVTYAYDNNDQLLRPGPWPTSNPTPTAAPGN